LPNATLLGETDSPTDATAGAAVAIVPRIIANARAKKVGLDEAVQPRPT
jgi:hypothetical protein